MKLKRFISLILCVVMVAACLMPLTACNKKCKEHIDSNADGKCDKCDAAVTVQCTQHIDANSDGKCDNCNQTVEVTPPPAGKTNYTVSVKTAGGMPLSGITVYVYNKDGFIVDFGSTNDSGISTITLDTASGYSVRLDGVPEGYTVLDGLTAETRYAMGPTGVQIPLISKPITEGKLQDEYLLGDVMYDFTITDIDGVAYKLSDLLKEKRMVMLNFWYVDCSWCNKEFPGLNDSYEKYSEKIEILAINDYATDTAVEVKQFPTTGTYEDDNLTFPFFKISDTKSLTIGKFGGFGEGNTGYPTTVIIDKYGVICMIEQGAIVGESKWNKIFDHFTSDNYVQKLVEKAEDLTPAEKPDVEWGGSDGIKDSFVSGDFDVTFRPEEGDEYSWPFVPTEKDGVQLVAPSNKSDNSYAILYADIALKPGQAVMFDYFASCQYSSDNLYIIVDGDDICALTGINDGDIATLADWEQCCAYVDPRPVTESNKDETVVYSVAFVYIKDTDTSEGDDAVYLKNLRVISVNEITTETYIIREAASKPTSDNGGYETYVSYVLGDDGYYHVTDKNGPLLLVNFLGYTNFDSYQTVSQRVMDAGQLMVNGVDKYNNWMVYANASANSAMYGFSPVTEELKEILVAYCNFYMNEAAKDPNENLWLQLCSFYDAYGQDKDGNPTPQVPDPIKGLTTISPFVIDPIENPDENTKEIYEVTYDRVVMPRGYLYKFTPSVSGVYRFTSRADQEMNGWIFTGSSLEWISTVDGEREVVADFEEEERFCPALNIDNGNGTFTRDMNNVSLIAYMVAGEDYYIDIAYYDLYAVGTFEFEVTYEGATKDVFAMASPGPITYIETATGDIGGLIALGIDYAFKEDNGVMYAYQVLERDASGEPTKWGEKLYADLYYPTIPFPSQSIEELAAIGAFDFSISEIDRDAMVLLEDARINGKNAIITKWINEGNANARDEWTNRNLDNILLALQKGEDTSMFAQIDVAVAEEALEIGMLALKKELGLTIVGDESEWVTYKMDDALNGNLSNDTQIREQQVAIIAGIDDYFNNIYKFNDVAKGIFHGEGKDETDTIQRYIDAMEEDASFPERMGCVALTQELSEILSQLYSKFNFDDVEHDFLKFCFYYKQLGK